MPKYAINYEWTCPQCGTYNSKSYFCEKCFYEPKTPKQRASPVAIACGAGCILLVVFGAWLIASDVTGGYTLVIVGALLGWAAVKW
jgi:hypothetical protein